MGTTNGKTSETWWRAYNIDVSCENHNISLFSDPLPYISVVSEKQCVLLQIDERSGGPPYEVSVSE